MNKGESVLAGVFCTTCRVFFFCFFRLQVYIADETCFVAIPSVIEFGDNVDSFTTCVVFIVGPQSAYVCLHHEQ